MFREILYDLLGIRAHPQPFVYMTTDWAVALIGALLLLGLGFFGVFARVIFAINRRGGPAKIAGWLTALTLAFGWLGITLELAGFMSLVIFPAVVIVVLAGLGAYVAVSR